MIKLKSLLTEDISEMNNVTKALQTAIDNFNKPAIAEVGAKGFFLMKLSTNYKSNSVNSNLYPDGVMLYQSFKWDIWYTSPAGNRTSGGTHDGTPFYFGTLTIWRDGKDTAVENPIIRKVFNINNTTDPASSQTLEVCKYDADRYQTPTWADTNTALAAHVNGFKKMIADSTNVPNQTDYDPAMRNTIKFITSNGAKLVEDLKTIFNDIEIAPVTPTGKKTWKGMKQV